MDLGHEKLFQNKHAWVIRSLNILFKYLLHNIVTLWNGDNTVTDVQTNVNVGIYCGYLNSFGITKTFRSYCSLVACWALIQKIKEFYTHSRWVAFRFVKKAEEPVLAIQSQSFQGEPYHAFLSNCRSQLLYLADYKDGCHRMFKSIQFRSMHWSYPYRRDPWFALQAIHILFSHLVTEMDKEGTSLYLHGLIEKEIKGELKADTDYIRFLLGKMPTFQ